jgi:cell division protease FtsH
MHQQRQFSEATMETIDQEVARILREASGRAADLLKDQQHLLEKLKVKLLEKEELDEGEITAILGPSIHAKNNGHAQGKSAADLAATP